MFELSVALKYLIPRKKQLSVSLIALLSVAVISLVVWLVLVFLSVTEGIERNWLQKLTTLNAPVRITPTKEYFASYYYQVDGISSASHYSLKTLAEKLKSSKTDPYDPSLDGELPARFPLPDLRENGAPSDPVLGLYTLLSHIKHSQSDLAFQDFELSGGLMRLQLLRPGSGVPEDETQGYLTQVSYLASLPDQCPGLHALLLPPSEKDINHLLYLASHSTELSRQDSPMLTLKTDQQKAEHRMRELLGQVKIQKLKPRYPLWQVPLAFLPDRTVFEGAAHYRNGRLARIDLPTDLGKRPSGDPSVRLWKEGHELYLESPSQPKQRIASQTPLLLQGPLELNVIEATAKEGLSFRVKTALQGTPIDTEVSFEGLEVLKADFTDSGLWLRGKDQQIALPLNEEKETGVLLAKNFIDSGVMIGDRGYISYSSTTTSSLQEHRLPIFVAGFYDPGVLSVGNKCILVPPFVTRTINASSSSFNLDKTQSSGVLVWFNDLQSAEAIKQQIVLGLKEQGLEKYWKVTTFREYDFAKDLMEQFQSDKYLFALVGLIILIVACCNIISMLVLLVNDKKREIGILQTMGASRFSIAAIFGICGVAMGILSSALGTVAALLTLHHIDAIVQLLSFFQGHEAFNASFFGKTLPSHLSGNAVTFILIATPLISLIAGLVPAIKACRLRPSEILRSE